MRKFYLLLLLCITCFFAFSQEPFIGTAGGDGLGQYGYLEKDAVTFSRLFRNTYNNIAYLSARWWISDNDNTNGNGKEYIYNVHDFPVSAGGDWDPFVGWQCGGDNSGSKRTTDYDAANFSPEWRAGSDCYISVCAKYCDNSFYPGSFDGASTYGSTGFNERHLQVVDVDNTLHTSTATDIPDGDGTCVINNSYHVAGSFAITAGTLTGISLTTLYVKNNGTAAEGTDIPNGALHVYYEAATGSEVFGDGNETLAGTLWGDWGGGSTSDNIFGNESLNIPLNGKIRVYVLLCDYNSATAVGTTINLGIINDGISLAPALNNFSKLRINPASISQRNITLPVKFISFNGSRDHANVQLKWQVEQAANVNDFVVQQSYDGIHFSDVGARSANDYTQQRGNYQFSLSSNAVYFRILLRASNGTKLMSNIISLPARQVASIRLLQNPVEGHLSIENTSGITARYVLRLMDITGRKIVQQQVTLQPGTSAIPIPPGTASQMLLLQLQDEAGTSQSFKIIRK